MSDVVLNRYKLFVLRLALGCLVLSLSACAFNDKEQQFENVEAPEPGKGVVYLYRSNMYDLKDAMPNVYIDGEPQGMLEHATYKLWQLNEGEYELSVKAGEFFEELLLKDTWEIRERKITVALKPGEVYFVRLKPSVMNNTLGWRDAKLTLVEQSVALKEIKGYTYAD